MIIQGALIFFALLCGSSLALYSSKDAVIQLSTKTFSQVLESEHGWMVEFYAPWCGHCKNLAPEYKKAAEKKKGILKFAAIDCDDASNQPVCGRYGIKGFPTLKFFQSDKTGDKKLPLDYNGERSAKAMIDYVSSRVSDKNVHVISSSGKLTLEDFYSKKNDSLSKVLLFTDKTSTPLLYKSLSLEYKNRLVFGEVRNSEKKIVKEFGIENYPTLLVIKAGAGEVLKYDGSIGYSEIMSFLDEIAPPATKSSPSTDAKKPVKREPFDPKVPQVSSDEDFQKYCVKSAESGVSSLCVLAFLPTVESEYEESIKQHEDFVKILSNVKKQMYDAVETDAMPSMHFVWLDGMSEASQKVINKFGLSSELPSIMVISPRKKVFRPYLRALEERPFFLFLKETGRGGGKVFTYNWDIDFPSNNKVHDEF